METRTSSKELRGRVGYRSRTSRTARTSSLWKKFTKYEDVLFLTNQQSMKMEMWNSHPAIRNKFKDVKHSQLKKHNFPQSIQNHQESTDKVPTNRSETVTSNQKSFVQQFFTIEYSSTISYHWTWPRTHPTRPDLTKSPNNTALEIPLEGWFSWPVRSVGRWILQIQSLQNNRISSSKKNYFFCTHLNHFIHSFCTLNPQSISYQPIRSKFRTDIYTH